MSGYDEFWYKLYVIIIPPFCLFTTIGGIMAMFDSLYDTTRERLFGGLFVLVAGDLFGYIWYTM